VVFGELVNGVGAETGLETLKKMGLINIGVGGVIWLMSLLMIALSEMYAERLAFTLKIEYFRKCLEKNAAWYDEHNPTEMAAKISKEISAIQRGNGQKVSSYITGIAGFVFGIGLSFYYGWKLTLILMGSMPILSIIGMMMGAAMVGGTAEEMKAYAQSAGYAEQAL
jgi:ATP-binding cassette subfamily B (MDR/TAP) protein 1